MKYTMHNKLILPAIYLLLVIAPYSADVFSVECATNDVTFQVTESSDSHIADACDGWVDQAGNPTNETSYVNTLTGNGWDDGDDWQFLTKSDNGATGTGLFAGVSFTLQADNVSAGDWTLTWDMPETSVLLDFAFVFKVSTEMASYLFINEEIGINTTAATGEFVISKVNRNNNPQNLSHLTLLARTASTAIDIPEPSSFYLFFIGLFAFGIMRNKHLNHKPT